MGQTSDTTEEERMVMRECVYEAFWYRSLPLATVTGVCVKLGVTSGKIRHTRYGAWPIVLGAGSMAYIVGKLSYIFGENCARKFVEQAPSSEIAQEFKRRRPEMVAAVEKEGREMKIPSVEQRNLGFSDVLEDLDFETVSDKEKLIMRDCNSIAFWRYSLPLSVVTSVTVLAFIKAGMLKPSKLNTTFPRLPKILIGSVLGYIAGQWVYVYSKDCPARFIEFAPEGEIAKRLQGQYICKDCAEKVNLNETTGDEVEGPDDYVMPSNENVEVEKLIKDQCSI